MRLNRELRGQIRDKLIERRFKADQDQLKSDMQALADDFYFSLFTATERTLLASCPADWFQESNSMVARYQGRHVSLEFSSSKWLPQSLCHYREELPPLYAKRYAKLKERKDSLDKRAFEASCQIMGVLKSVCTTETLLRTWPEIAAHIPAQPTPTAAPLAIPIKQLNQQLGLP